MTESHETRMSEIPGFLSNAWQIRHREQRVSSRPGGHIGCCSIAAMKLAAAVVAAIFLVIVLDAFFAVFFSSIGWN